LEISVYSPDLKSNNYRLFPARKQNLGGSKFKDNSEVVKDVALWVLDKCAVECEMFLLQLKIEIPKYRHSKRPTRVHQLRNHNSQPKKFLNLLAPELFS